MSQLPAGRPDIEEFVSSARAFRRELLAHCYRMLGSIDEAEDLVQETYLRAWRGYGQFAGRSSMRGWLYRIATNACLSALSHRQRRVLPTGLRSATEDPFAEPSAAGPWVAWLEPIPDHMVGLQPEDPASVVISRESMRLALIASLQYLPSRQRAVLLLRDVLSFPAAEVAEILDTSTAAVKSTLQRARRRLEQVSAAEDQIAPPSEAEARELLDRYVAAIENADAAALRRLLREDASLEATPLESWFQGRSTCIPFLAEHVLGSSGDWRMHPTRANGQPAAIAYHRDGEETLKPYGVVVLTAKRTGISRITAFGDPALVSRFSEPIPSSVEPFSLTVERAIARSG